MKKSNLKKSTQSRNCKNKKKKKVVEMQPTFNIFKFAAIGFVSFLLIFIAVKAAPPTSPYSPGETLDPTCSSITDENCTVTVPAVSGANSDITSLGSGNIGIGTTSPVAFLDVAGSGRFKGTATSVLTGTIDPAASTTVTGVGTAFTTELVVGDRITVTGETQTVTAIASDTSLTIDSAFSDNANDTSPDKLAAELIVKDSDDNVDFIIKDNGRVGIGTTSPQTLVQIGPTNAGQTGYSAVGVQITVDDDSGGRWQALRGDSWVTSGTGLGVNGTAAGVGATENIGLYAWAEGATTANYGAQLWAYQHDNDATLTNIYGAYVSSGIYTGKSGNITNAYGYYGKIINNGTGTIANGYGLYLEDLVATTAYGIYQAGADDTNYFAGSVGVGTTTLRANSTLDVNGIIASIQDMDWIGYYVGESATVGGGFSWRNTLNRVDISSVGYGYPIDISGSSLSLQGASAGNVGIGTTTPGYNLDVSGTAHISGSLASEADYDPIDDGLVLYFPFAEGTGSTVYDRSSYGNDTTSFEGTPTWTTSGKFGNAMSFDGNDVDGTEYIEIPDSSSLDVSSAMTIEAWVYPIAFPEGGATSQFSLISDKRVTYTGAAFWFGLNNLDLPHFGITTDGSTFISADGTVALTTDRWYHLVGTYDGSYVRNYVDGVLVGTSAETSGDIYNSSAAIRIGAGHDQDGGGDPVSFTYFDGTIDEFRLYNRALSADEIREQYERGLGGEAPYTNLGTGYVGVNTTSPLTALDVAGSGRFKGTATSVLTGTIDPEASTTVTGVETAFTTELVPGDRITVTGETRTVTAIASATSLTVDVAFTDNANDTSPDKLASELILKDSDDNVDFIVADNGYVGIGTTGSAFSLPSFPLHVVASVGGGAPPIWVTNTNEAGYAGVNFETSAGYRAGVGLSGSSQGSPYDGNVILYTDPNTSSDIALLARASDANILFFTGGTTEKARIDYDGNVGVGVTDPDEKLEVAGHYKASGTAPTLSSCGTTPAIAGADSAGKITIGTGATTSCTVTFATAFAQAPACIITGDNSAVSYAATTTTDVLTITSSADMDSDVISYICFGNGS